MSGPRVLLDCDGVLADFVGGVLPIIAEVTGRAVTREEWTSWDFAASFGLSCDEARRIRLEISRRDRFCSDLAPCPGAMEGVTALLRRQAEIYVVTAPWDSCSTWERERKMWLRDHLGIPFGHVLHVPAHAKPMIDGDIFVEDRTTTLSLWSAARRRANVYLDRSVAPLRDWCAVDVDGRVPVRWATPHNRGEAWGGLEATTWDQVVEIYDQVRGGP